MANTCRLQRLLPERMRILALIFVFVSSIASAQFPGQKLAGHDVSTSAAGAAVAVSPRNNKAVVAYADGKVLFSIDAGLTWKPSSVDLTKGVVGNVAVSSDARGNFFLVYSVDPDSKGKSEDAWMSQIVGRHSSDDGKTFSEAVIIATIPGKDVFNPVVTTFPKREDMIVTWSQSDSYGSESAD